MATSRTSSPETLSRGIGSSPALSMADTVKKVGGDAKVSHPRRGRRRRRRALTAMQRALKAAGAQSKIIAPRLGSLTHRPGPGGHGRLELPHRGLRASSTRYSCRWRQERDHPGGRATRGGVRGRGLQALQEPSAPPATGWPCSRRGIGAGKAQSGQKERRSDGLGVIVVGKGSDTNGVAAEFIRAVAQHRHWSRERKE